MLSGSLGKVTETYLLSGSLGEVTELPYDNLCVIGQSG